MPINPILNDGSCTACWARFHGRLVHTVCLEKYDHEFAPCAPWKQGGDEAMQLWRKDWSGFAEDKKTPVGLSILTAELDAVFDELRAAPGPSTMAPRCPVSREPEPRGRARPRDSEAQTEATERRTVQRLEPQAGQSGRTTPPTLPRRTPLPRSAPGPAKTPEAGLWPDAIAAADARQLRGRHELAQPPPLPAAELDLLGRACELGRETKAQLTASTRELEACRQTLQWVMAAEQSRAASGAAALATIHDLASKSDLDGKAFGELVAKVAGLNTSDPN